MFKNQPPDRLWEYFLYQTASKNHARLTGSLRIVRKPQNLTEIDPKIFLGRRQRRSLLNLWFLQFYADGESRWASAQSAEAEPVTSTRDVTQLPVLPLALLPRVEFLSGQSPSNPLGIPSITRDLRSG